MAGLLLHLSAARKVAKVLENKFEEKETLDFYAGNIIPDEVRGCVKNEGHYRKQYLDCPLLLVDVQEAKQAYLENPSPLTLGIYLHLYVDHYFLVDLLFKKVSWKDNSIYHPKEELLWSAKDFAKGYIQDVYAHTNMYMFDNEKDILDLFNIIPKKLPSTGYEMYDDRKEYCWQETFDSDIKAELKETNFDILEPEETYNTIGYIADKFINEELEYLITYLNNNDKTHLS